MKSDVKYVNKPTYTRFIVGDIPQYDATQNAFSLMTYDPAYETVRASQLKNMKEMITADTDIFMEMAFRRGAWATAYNMGNISGVYSWGGQGMLSWSQLGRSPFLTSSIRTLDATDRDYATT